MELSLRDFCHLRMYSVMQLEPKADSEVYSSTRPPGTHRLSASHAHDEVLAAHLYDCASTSAKVGSRFIYAHGIRNTVSKDDDSLAWKVR